MKFFHIPKYFFLYLLKITFFLKGFIFVFLDFYPQFICFSIYFCSFPYFIFSLLRSICNFPLQYTKVKTRPSLTNSKKSFPPTILPATFHEFNKIINNHARAMLSLFCLWTDFYPMLNIFTRFIVYTYNIHA